MYAIPVGAGQETIVSTRDGCFMDAAEVASSLQLCEKVGEEWINTCYFQVATKDLKNPQCDELEPIGGIALANGCWIWAAQWGGNSAFCNRLRATGTSEDAQMELNANMGACRAGAAVMPSTPECGYRGYTTEPLEEAPSPEVCNDNKDNDADGDKDCADSDCAGDTKCAFKVSGTVSTGAGRPLSEVKISLRGSDGKEIVSGYTDASGAFSLDYSAKAASLGIPGSPYGAYLRISLEDQDGDFKIMWGYGRINQLYSIDTAEFSLPTEQIVGLDLMRSNILLGEKSKVPGPNWDTHWDAAHSYYNAKRFFDFARSKLGYGFGGAGSTLPISIYIYSPETGGAFYMPPYGGNAGGVYIAPYYSRQDNAECPENCLWHELFHFTMYNKYGSWAPENSPYQNHAGFKNNNTGDSYEEAFAEFWPNILSLELDGDAQHIYGNTWNMELDYNPWTKEGTNEEFAMSTLLWDMFDPNEDKGEKLSVPYTDLWNVLMSQCRLGFKDIYDALKAKWPAKSGEIDELFVAHGIFKDTNPGNGKYDNGEPFWDKNQDGIRQSNEEYVDIGTPDDLLLRPHQVYTPGEEIGTASSYNRTTRTNKPLEEDSFVKVGVTSNGAAVDDALLKVSYSFSNPSLNYVSYGVIDNETGYVYVEIPPDEYQMTASITADNYEGSQPLSVTPDDYYAAKSAGMGYIESGTIAAGAKKSNYCNNDRICQSVESPGCADCASLTGAAADQPPGGTSGGQQTGGGTATPGQKPTVSGSPDTAMILVIVVIVIVIIAVIAAVALSSRKKGGKPSQKAAPQNVVVQYQAAGQIAICPRCGAQVPGDFCPACGARVK